MTCRPSALYDLDDDPFVAFCFDRAVNLFGRSLEDAMTTVAEGAKDRATAEAAARRVLDRWLGSADPVEARAPQFRDPFAEGRVG